MKKNTKAAKTIQTTVHCVEVKRADGSLKHAYRYFCAAQANHCARLAVEVDATATVRTFTDTMTVFA